MTLTNSAHIHNEGSYFDFEKLFEEVPLDPPWPHCKLFRAPEFPAEYIEEYEIFKFNGTRPKHKSA